MSLQLFVVVLLHVGNPALRAVWEITHDLAWMVLIIAVRRRYCHAYGEGENGGDSDDKMFELHVGLE